LWRLLKICKMRKTFLLLPSIILLFGIFSYAQNTSPIIWSEDFENGIPSSWINLDENTSAMWEYRGPNSSPNLLIGSRGSCTNNFEGAPIASTSQNNGFIIFDSNYWDNDSLPCAGEFFGTGPAPGPHSCALTTPSIDLTGVNYAMLQFEQYVRFFDGATSIEMSIEQGPWINLFSNNIPFGGESVNAETVQIILPPSATQTNDLRIRFSYNGLYYFWQIDDVQIIEILNHDLAITSTTYGHFGQGGTGPTGFEFMEYHQYPSDLAPMLFFDGIIENNGGMNLNDCYVTAKVKNTLTNQTLYSANSDTIPLLGPGTASNFSIPAFQMPADTGNYMILFETHQTEVDLNAFNNTDTALFRISPCVLARDEGTMSNIYNPNSTFWNIPFEISNIYAPSDTFFVSAITVGLGKTSALLVNDSLNIIRGKIYSFQITDSITYDLIAETNWHPLDSSLLNEIGENKFMALSLPDTTMLLPGVSYMVAIENPFGPNHLHVGINKVAEQTTAWYKNFEGFFYTSKTPMIRLQSCFDTTIFYTEDTTSTVVETFNDLSWTLYPNPSEDYFQIRGIDGEKAIQYRLMDYQGRTMLQGRLKNVSEKIDIHTLDSGCYIIQVTTDRIRKHLYLIKP